MKNILAPLAFVLVVFLASCGGKTEETGNKEEMNETSVVDSTMMKAAEAAGEIKEDIKELDSLMKD